jgi:hypothetical protein
VSGWFVANYCTGRQGQAERKISGSSQAKPLDYCRGPLKKKLVAVGLAWRGMGSTAHMRKQVGDWRRRTLKIVLR